MLEPFSGVHFALGFVKLRITFSISMYIMCVMFIQRIDLSHGVDALQTSINVVVIITPVRVGSDKETGCQEKC